MSRIEAVDVNRAQGTAAELLSGVKQMLGGAPNLFRVTAQAPAALESMVGQFVAASHGELPPKVREAIALAVAEANGCDYCLSAHSLLGKNAGLNAEELLSARRGQSSDAKLAAVLGFARSLVLNRGQVGPEALTELRSARVSDGEALEIVANVALNIFTNYVNIVAETEIDFPVVRAESK